MFRPLNPDWTNCGQISQFVSATRKSFGSNHQNLDIEVLRPEFINNDDDDEYDDDDDDDDDDQVSYIKNLFCELKIENLCSSTFSACTFSALTLLVG